MKIEEHPFIRNFAGELGGAFCDTASIHEIGEGAIVFDEGDSAESIYLVLEGQVVIEKGHNGSELFVLDEANVGGYFGELAVLDGARRSGRARAAVPCTLAEIRAAELFRVLRNAPSASVVAFFLPLVSNLRARSDRSIRTLLGKEKLALVGEMADSIMHDFRSPLTTIQLACDLLRREISNEKSERYCDMADKQIRLLQSMMEELLEFSRADLRLKRAPVNAADLFAEFRTNNELVLQKSKIELVIEATDGVLRVDSEKVLRAMQNLFNNSMDAMRDGGKIYLGTRPLDNEFVCVIVRDEGPGIPEEIRDRVFEPFLTYGKEKGTGIGLAVVKTLIEAHGGSVTFSTEVGKGTEFQLRLPSHTVVQGRRKGR